MVFTKILSQNILGSGEDLKCLFFFFTIYMYGHGSMVWNHLNNIPLTEAPCEIW